MTHKNSLYPDILFHFTSKEGLYGILENTFSMSYAREKITSVNNTTEFAVPMVSFCDLRLSELKVHMDKYGSYGIGLSKKWANDKGLNPVFYVNKYSPFTEGFIKAVERLYKQLDLTKGIIAKAMAEDNYMNILNAYRYIKNYEGELVRNKKLVDENYRFADEREWRYIPPLQSTDFPFVPIDEISTIEQKEKFNNMVSHIKLSFEPEDIKYLIIKHDNEITGLINHLENVKGKFSVKVRRRLTSRILTSEQIKKDI